MFIFTLEFIFRLLECEYVLLFILLLTIFLLNLGDFKLIYGYIGELKLF
jgi:hypothetical protein